MRLNLTKIVNKQENCVLQNVCFLVLIRQGDNASKTKKRWEYVTGISASYVTNKTYIYL